MLTSATDQARRTSTPGEGEQSARSARAAAGEFEAMLLGQWLQAAESTFASVPGADQDQDAGSEQIKAIGVQSLARGLAAQGGIGISRMISQALLQHGADRTSGEPPTVAAWPPGLAYPASSGGRQ